MEAEKFSNLYEFCWFEHRILNRNLFSSKNSNSSISAIQDEPTTPTKPKASLKSQVQIHHNRSMSDQSNSNPRFDSAFSSPNTSPKKLCTILSGMEISDHQTSSEKPSDCQTEPPRKRNTKEKKERKKRSQTKSLSDLEFEEVKGFMDLGFVFSEKDRDSSLAEIIPGLHRLGKNNNINKEEEDEKKEEKEEEEEEEEEEEKQEERDIFDDENEEEALISRPYLSEAWKVLDLMPKKEYQSKPLMNWRFPAQRNEICMKDNLRFWAHAVASTVR